MLPQRGQTAPNFKLPGIKTGNLMSLKSLREQGGLP